MKTLKDIVLYGLPAAVISSAPLLAEGTADTTVTGLVDNAQATYNYVLPIMAGIAGTFIAWRLGRRVLALFGR